MSERPLRICAIGVADSTHIASRTRCFAERGHHVYLITEAPGSTPIEGVTEVVPGSGSGAVVRALRGLLRTISAKGDYPLRAVLFLAALRRCRPDIVHVHYAYHPYAWLAGMLGCRPLVVTVMGGDILFEEQGDPTAAGKWLTLHLLRQADYITSKSSHLISVLDQLGGFGTKAERIVWGISLAQFRPTDSAPLRARLGLRPGQRVVLSPKILRPFYRPHLIVEAMALVVRTVPDAVLVVTEYLADSAYRAQIDSRIRELGLADNVTFCGRVLHADMPAYYSLAEMTVAVPPSDGLPQTLLEGMACGTPSVLGRLPRYEEIVSHGTSAYFVDADPRSIATGILELFADPELRARIARNALAIVRDQASLEEQAGRVERRFYELARTPSRAWSPLQFCRALIAYRRASSAMET